MRGMYKSHSLAPRRSRTPSGRVTIHVKRRNPAAPTCAKCGATLHGTARGTPFQVRRTPPRHRAPSRIYGGNLCARCTRQKLKEEARQ